MLLLSVITNDLHQFVFPFPRDAAVWTAKNNGYGTGYFLIVVWAGGLALASPAAMIEKCRTPKKRGFLYLPLIPIAVLALYSVLWGLKLPIVRTYQGDYTVATCLLTMLTLESCIRCGLIQSNTHYSELFRLSGLSAQITDSEYRVCYSSAAMTELPVSIMRKAERLPVMLDPNRRLSSAPIRGGRVLWVESIAEFNALIEQLARIGEELSESNALLSAELELAEKQARVDARSRLYDTMAREPEQQMLCSELTMQDKLKRICVTGTYIKRRCALLLNEAGQSASVSELTQCFKESTEALSHAGFAGILTQNGEAELPMRHAVLCYDVFEEIIETLLPNISGLYIRANVRGAVLKVVMKWGSLASCP